MADQTIAHLADRGVVGVTGSDAVNLLQGLITNDMAALNPTTNAIHAGLLSPQGKILFDFFVVLTTDGFLLDVASNRAAELVKRLSMYKLRADASIVDLSERFQTFATWGPHVSKANETKSTVAFRDPRHPELGLRILSKTSLTGDDAAAQLRGSPVSSYHAHRLALGVPEGGRDFEFADTYPHEADFDLLHGVSFTKGCYVGQEVVARMQNKTVVRKRVIKVEGKGALTHGAEILLGEAVIGRIGTVDGDKGLAMLRLDRAIEAEDKDITLLAAGTIVKPDAAALASYAKSAAGREAAPGIL